ncbi:MAG: hypothetical protein ABL883_05355 [Terricaulis sp.]
MISTRSIVLSAIASVVLIGPAFARDPVFTARIEAPLATGDRVIAQNAIWSCDGDTCRARPNHGVSVRACRQFVRESGARVTAYGSEGRELSADEIARCNGEASGQQARNE